MVTAMAVDTTAVDTIIITVAAGGVKTTRADALRILARLRS
jgi:hypothetical protein